MCDLGEGRDADGLVRLADQALYSAKDHGRDLACQYSPQIASALGDEARAERLARGHAQAALAQSHAPPTPAAARPGTRSAWPTWRGGSRSTSAGPPNGPPASGRPPCCTISGRWGCRRSRRTPTTDGTPRWGAIAAAALSAEQCEWIRHQHERWDGGGVPDGLLGESIPEGARILAVADAWESAGSGAAHAGADGRHWPAAVRALARTVIPRGGESNGSPSRAPRPAA